MKVDVMVRDTVDNLALVLQLLMSGGDKEVIIDVLSVAEKNIKSAIKELKQGDE